MPRLDTRPSTLVEVEQSENLSERKELLMQIGMIGLGRMGANMVRRLLTGGHQCIVFDRSPKAVQELVEEKAVGSSSLGDFVKKLTKPRAAWVMVPGEGVVNSIA